MLQAKRHINESAVDMKGRRRSHAKAPAALQVFLHALQVDVVLHLILVARQIETDLRGVVEQMLFLEMVRVGNNPAGFFFELGASVRREIPLHD